MYKIKIKHILKSLCMEKPVNLLQPIQPVRNKVVVACQILLNNLRLLHEDYIS